MIQIITYKDMPIRFDDGGEGTPVVLLHGYLESLNIWDDFASPLSEKYRVIAIDLPGHGETGVIDETSSMEFMAEIVKAVLDYLEIEKCFLIGHSMGGYVTLAFLQLYPERLSGFSLFHSKPQPDTPAAIENRKRSIKLVKEGKKELIVNTNVPNCFASINLEKFKDEVEFAKQIARKTPDEGIIAALNGMLQRPSRDKILAETELPFLFILGKQDNFITFNDIYPTFKLPKNGKFLILDNSGHMGFMEEKDKALEGVIYFIDSISQ
ncbi:MAG: alpha/beta hydrolase [Bacteroidales bacterium]|nr:alpha/beta hydrolase [Bacteroidales bacterium]